MKFNNPIEGARIRLWCITLKDARAIAAILTPDVTRWLASWPADPTIEAVAVHINRARNAMQQNRALHFRIEERERSLTAGYVGVAQAASDPATGHLSYWLGGDFQGKGLMTEAVRHAMATGFQHLDLARIEAGAQPENLSSFAVMRRVGMTPIGERMVWADSRRQNEKCLFYAVDRSSFMESVAVCRKRE